MPNKNYVKGRRKEYKICHELRDCGLIALRTAGSHGFVDVIGIDIHNKEIRFIQAKPDDYSDSKVAKLLEEHKDITGLFKVSFEVI